MIEEGEGVILDTAKDSQRLLAFPQLQMSTPFCLVRVPPSRLVLDPLTESTRELHCCYSAVSGEEIRRPAIPAPLAVLEWLLVRLVNFQAGGPYQVAGNSASRCD